MALLRHFKFFMKSANFIMLYTGDFVLRYYVGFSQIRSHMYIYCKYVYNVICESYFSDKLHIFCDDIKSNI